MTDIAIRVENLSKLYRIGPRERYKALRDTLTDAMYAPFRRLAQSAKGGEQNAVPSALCPMPSADFIWALKDVSFEVRRGEVVGIIGRNGAVRKEQRAERTGQETSDAMRFALCPVPLPASPSRRRAMPRSTAG